MMMCDLLLLYLFASALMDMTYWRIANTWIAFGIVSALFFRAVFGVPYEIVPGFLAACPLILLYAAGVMGAGDVKLFMVVGCFLGGGALYLCLVSGLVCVLPPALMLYLCGGTEKRGKRHVIPLAPAIFLGVMCYRLDAFLLLYYLF